MNRAKLIIEPVYIPFVTSETVGRARSGADEAFSALVESRLSPKM